MATETPTEYRTMTELKRIHQTPPPFSILKSMITSKLKKPEILRMSTAQLARSIIKRPETPFKLEDKLKIVGCSHQYNRYFETESKPMTSQLVSRKTTLSISRQSARRKNEYSSAPKYSMEDFNKLHVKEDIEMDQILYRNSAKLEILYKEKQMKHKNILLILSVEFILTEGKFWKEDEIEEDSVRHWKKLQAVSNIVWIVKKEKNLRKMQVFAERVGIPCDTVCLLRRPKKKKVITVNLKLVEFEMGMRSYQKVVYVDGMSADHEADKNNQHYSCKFPMTSAKNISVNMIEYQQSLKSVFCVIPNILYKEPIQILNLNPVLQSYSHYISKHSVDKSRNSVYKLKIKQFVDFQQETGDQYSDLLKRTDQLKGVWIKEITTRYKLQKKQRQTEKDSIPYVIGDLLKRNFQIMSDLKVEEKKCQGVPEKIHMELFHDAPKLKYNNLIYIWKF